MAYRYSLILLVLMCISQTILIGQPLSRYQKVYTDKRVFKTIDSLNELAFEVKRNDIHRAFSIIFSALNLAKNNNYTKGIATSLLYQGGLYQQAGFSKRALSVYYQSLTLSRKINDTFNIARATQQLANALSESGNKAQAEGLFKEAMKMYISLNRADEIVNIKNGLGLINISKKEYGAAGLYFKQALAESNAQHYNYGYKKSLYNLGLLELEKNNLDLSKKYIEQALQLDSLKNDKYGIAIAKTKLSAISYKMRKYDESLKFAKEASVIAHDVSALQIELEALGNITRAYKEKKDFKTAAEWDTRLIDHYKQLYEHEKVYAVEFLDILDSQLKDQLAIEKNAMLSQQKVKQTRTFLSIVGVALVILSILSYLLFKNFKKANRYSKALKKQNQLIERNALSLNRLNQEISKQNFALEGSNQMKDKLLSILSHDLRNPLSNTKGIISLINSELISKEEQESLLVKLEEQYTRSLNLLDDLLLWVGSQMNGSKTEMKNTELKELFTSLIDDQKVSLENKDINIENKLEKKLDVKGDKEMLKIIFRNLISNAIKFTHQGGSLKIYSTNSRGVNIHIEDNGVGMTEEELNKINKREYFTKTGTARELGSGFGLRLSQDLINIHGGSLSVKSEKNVGSTFTVSLPAV